MQGQRTTVESLSETYDIDHAHNTGSSVAAIDSQLYWNNAINPPPSSLPSYLMSPDEAEISYAGNINRRQPETNEGDGEETKVEGRIPNRRLEERGLNRGGINLNRALDGDEQELARAPRSGGGDGVASQNGICPIFSNSYARQPEQAPSTSTTAGRLTSSMDGRRLLGKRKNMEGDLGQSSGSFQQTESGFFCNSSARNAASSSSLSLNPRTGAEQESPEGSNRSIRMRLNPGAHADAHAPDWQSFMGSSGGPSTIWAPPHPSSLFGPAAESPEARLTTPNPSSLSQPRQLQPQGFPRLVLPIVRNSVPVARVGSSSNSPQVLPERSATITRRSNNSIIETPIFGPAPEARVVGQLPVDWSLANGSNLNTIAGNPVSSLQVGPMNPRAHYQNLPGQYPRTLSEFVRRTLPTVNPDPGAQPANLPAQRSSVRSSSPEIAPPPGAGPRGNHQHPLLRSAFLMDRRAGIMGAPLALRNLASSREGRSRMISEHIRNALDLMRRGENLRFEDVLILDHSAFYGLSDLHDRHRDMRLDVDNMSYEELLALEERIGNVNTGLSEEKIKKHLKHKMHLSSAGKSPDVAAAEPCCVCQEDYMDGDDIGTLDCGHEFHSECIKQWLAHKNICPICKMTALVT